MDDSPQIDSHAHVWDRTCPMVPGARYHPTYEAPVEAYLRVLDAHRVDKAALVQPSFLGTDNRYLLDGLRAHPDRLRGLVVVDPAVTDAALDDMTAAGVIGVRYNLIGRDPAWVATAAARALTHRITARGWWTEVQAEGAAWPMVVQVMESCGAQVMVDHFGKPAGPDCPGHRALLAADPARHCVKLSAPYRQGPADMAPYARAFLDAWGPARCLWGSDWPWTQHEHRHGYADSQAWLADWTSPKQRHTMAAAAPTLLGF